MEIKSRVPGKIVRFEKQVGDSVEVKDVLLSLIHISEPTRPY